MSTVSLVAVGDDTLQVVIDENGVAHVVVARVCEALGVDTDTQRKKLQSIGWAVHRTSLRPVRDSLNREQVTLCIDLDSLPMWLATIDVSKARPEAQAKLQRFQLTARDVLAEHLGMGGRSTSHLARASGGAVGSGGAVVVARAAPVGGVFEQLAAIEQMGGMLQGLLTVARQNAEALAAVSADVARVEGAVVEANARSADVALLVDSMAKKGVHFRESARAIKNATAYVSRRIRAEAPYTNYDWRTIYGAARNELGLARSPASSTSSPSGAPTKKTSPKPIGESIKRADQVLTYARVATKHGISGCDVATINRILNADDDANVVDADTQALQ